MRLHIFILISLIFLILYSSCRKMGILPRKVTVQAVDKTTDEPIPYARLSLRKEETGLLSSGGTTVETVETGSDGKATFSYREESGYIFRVYGVKEGYYNDYIPLIAPKGDVIPLPLQPEGYIRFHLKNVNPVGPSDRIRISGFQTIYGNEVDTIICCDTRFGNTEVIITYHVQRGGGEHIPHQINKYLPAHDTTLVTIEY